MDQNLLGKVPVATGISPSARLRQTELDPISDEQKIEIIAIDTQEQEDHGTSMTPLETIQKDLKAAINILSSN